MEQACSVSRRTRRRRGAVCPGADVECMVVRLSAGDHVGATDRAAAGRGSGIPVLGGGRRSRQRGAFPVPAAASWARDSGDRFHTGESQRLSRPGGQGAEVAERAGAAMRQIRRWQKVCDGDDGEPGGWRVAMREAVRPKASACKSRERFSRTHCRPAFGGWP